MAPVITITIGRFKKENLSKQRNLENENNSNYLMDSWDSGDRHRGSDDRLGDDKF